LDGHAAWGGIDVHAGDDGSVDGVEEVQHQHEGLAVRTVRTAAGETDQPHWSPAKAVVLLPSVEPQKRVCAHQRAQRQPRQPVLMGHQGGQPQYLLQYMLLWEQVSSVRCS